MMMLLENLRRSLAMAPTSKTGEVLATIDRLLTDSAPLRTKLARKLGLAPDASEAAIVGAIRERLDADAGADTAERPKGGGPSMNEDPRQIAADRVQRVMQESSLPFGEALKRVQQDHVLAENLANWYGADSRHGDASRKWDLVLHEAHGATDPREALRLRALEIMASKDLKFVEALRVARAQNTELAELVDQHYAGPAR
jgi:hypothetical protein